MNKFFNSLKSFFLKVFKKDRLPEVEDDEVKDEIDNTWKLKKVAPKIYLLTFGNKYDLALHFLRYQEYYENPNEQFFNQSFTIVDFMEWYSKNEGGGSFTYPHDWIGFNVPGSVFRDLLEKGITDFNKYDHFMIDIVEYIQNKLNGNKWDFYLIGAQHDNESTIEHELAHAFFYTDKEYRNKVSQIAAYKYCELYSAFKKFLTNSMYNEYVHLDEFQAYFATGLLDLEDIEEIADFDRDIKLAKNDFSAIFNEQKNKINVLIERY